MKKTPIYYSFCSKVKINETKKEFLSMNKQRIKKSIDSKITEKTMILEETKQNSKASKASLAEEVSEEDIDSKDVQMVIIKDPSGQSLIEEHFVDTLMDEQKSTDIFQ